MVVQHISADTIGLKVGTTGVQIRQNGTVKIGDRELPGPGEYDVSGVGAHVASSHVQLFAEGIRVAAVWSPMEASADDFIESDIYILLLEDTSAAESIITTHDPRMVILHNATLADTLAKKDGVAVASESQIKVTVQTLPAEERQIILLA